MIANPIVQREFVGLLKSPRTLYIQIAISVALTVLVLIRYPSNAIVGVSGAESRTVFQIVAFGLLASVLLIVPAFPATSIVREKLSGTLALLLNSPMRPSSIYFGKFFGVLLFFLLLLGLSLPALMACYSMGGISIGRDVGWLLLIVISSSILFICVGLLISTLSGTADSALRYTYAVAFGLTFATIVPHFFLQGKEGNLSLISEGLRHISPLTAMTSLLDQGQIASQGTKSLIDSMTSVYVFVIASLVISGVLMIVNIVILSRRIFDTSRSQGVITDDQSFAVRAVRRVFFLVDPNRRKAGIPFFISPVFMKEFRTRRLGRSHWFLRIMALLVIGSILLTYLSTSSTFDWGSDTIGGLMVLVQIALVILVAPSLASGLISTELESGGWNLLMLTPLRTISIVLGKLMSVFWTVFLLLLATLPGYLVLLWIQPTSVVDEGNGLSTDLELQVYKAVFTLVLATVYIISLSAMISSLFRRAAVSTAVSYGVTTLIFAGSFLVWFGRDTTFGYRAVRQGLLCNPISGALESIDMVGFRGYELISLNWYITGGLSVLFLVVFFVQTARLAKPS